MHQMLIRSAFHRFFRSIHKELGDSQRNSNEDSSRLKSLLEDCIKRFVDEERYKNDLRFLKIFILYVNVLIYFNLW